MTQDDGSLTGNRREGWRQRRSARRGSSRNDTLTRRRNILIALGALAGIVACAAPSAPAAAASGTNCAVQRCIALTFDDGPGPYTNKLLDELAARHAPATFFVVGEMVARRPAIVAREVRSGHAIGNHSWNHPQFTKLSDAQIDSQLARTNAAIYSAAKVRPSLVRPPYGAMNSRVLSRLAADRAAAVLWSVDTEDWKNRSVKVTTSRALAGARNGAIILMHDMRPTSVQAVPGIIDALRARGYTLVTVPQLLGGTTPGRAYFGR